MFPQDITKGADLTLLFVDQLNEETDALSYRYRIAEKKTTIIFKRPVLLLCRIRFVIFQCYTVKALRYMALSCTHTGLANAQFLIESQNFETNRFR